MRLFSSPARASFPVAVVAAFACGVAPLLAQTKDDGEIWTALVLQGKLGAKDTPLERWRLWLDVHDRQRDEGQHLDTIIVRPGVGYALNDRMTVHVGYAAVWTDAAGRDTRLEDRAWQQLVWMIPVGDLTVQSRTRLEQRFAETDGDTGWRLREFVKTTVPLTADKRAFVSAWDELFWDLDNTDWGQRAGFRQNRAFVGPGWFLGEAKKASIEVGYLNQWVDRPGEDKLNHCLSIWLFVNF
jgi:hypothetical protein